MTSNKYTIGKVYLFIDRGRYVNGRFALYQVTDIVNVINTTHIYLKLIKHNLSWNLSNGFDLGCYVDNHSYPYNKLSLLINNIQLPKDFSMFD